VSGHWDVAVDAVGKTEWDAMVGDFADADVFQTWDYGAAMWGVRQLSHLALRRDGRIEAGAQLRIVRLPVFGAGIAHVKWGPLWRRRGQAPSLENLRCMLRALRDEYVQRRGLVLRLVPREIDDAGGASVRALLAMEGFTPDPGEPPYRTFLLDLSCPLEVLQARLKKHWRRNLQRSVQSALTVRQTDRSDGLETLIRLYREMRARKGYVDFFDIDHYRALQIGLPPGMKLKIFIAEHAGQPVAAIAVSRLGDTAVCLLAATGDAGLRVAPSYLLQWRAIEWLREAGTHWYDLGGVNPERNPGTYRFKAGLAGGDATPVGFLGQFAAWRSVGSALAVGVGERLRACYRRARVEFSAWASGASGR
jgi:hypothetical protein